MKSPFRTNAPVMSIEDRLSQLESGMVKNQMEPEQMFTIKMTKLISGSILGAIAICFVGGYGCNHQDNVTKLDVAKICPAVLEKK